MGRDVNCSSRPEAHRLDEPRQSIPWPVALPQGRPPFRLATVTLRDSGFVFQLSLLPALLARRFQFLVALGMYRGLAAFEHVVRRDVANRAVQMYRVVVGREFAHDAPCILQTQGGLGPDAFAFEGLMPPFDFSVGLRVVRRGLHMGHAADADELFEVFGDELRAIVGDDARGGFGMFFLGPLQDNFDFGLGHGRADLPVRDGAAKAVQDAAQVVEGGANVHVGHVDMPMFMGVLWLVKARALLRFLRVPTA